MMQGTLAAFVAVIVAWAPLRGAAASDGGPSDTCKDLESSYLACALILGEGRSAKCAALAGPMLQQCTSIDHVGDKPGAVALAVPQDAPFYATYILDAAAEFDLEPELIEAVLLAESGGNPRAHSDKGAAGLMQLMPGTARYLGVDPWDPAECVWGGARYLREQLDEFGGDLQLALAAYNAGPHAVKKYQGIPPYPETTAYVKKVESKYHKLRAEGAWRTAR